MGKCRENKRRPNREGKVVTVGKAESVPAGRGATVKLKDGTEIALFNINGTFHAIENFCPHKGFPLTYNAQARTLNCPGHYAVYDCEAGGQETWGHATQNLPQYSLRIDDKGDIYAEGVDELIYGRLSNVL